MLSHLVEPGKAAVIFWMWKMKFPEENGLLSLKEYLNGRDKIWDSFRLLVSRPVPFP